MPANPNSLVPVAIAAIFAWRIFSRVRRNVGRQRLRPRNMIVRIVILALVTASVFGFCFVAPLLHGTVNGPMPLILGSVCGLILGAALGLVGLKLTQFEATPQGEFYTPNMYIGAGLSILFVGRVAYRLFALSNITPDSPRPPGALQSPLSLFIFELLAGYYIAYYAGLLARGRKAAPVATR